MQPGDRIVMARPSCLKVKVATVLDQAPDREVDRLALEDLRKLRARFRAVEGEDPMKAEEVTDQFIVSDLRWDRPGSIHADFGVWGPFGQRAAKSMKFVSHFLDRSGSWRSSLSFLGGVLVCLPQCGHHVRFRSARSFGPSRNSHAPHTVGVGRSHNDPVS